MNDIYEQRLRAVLGVVQRYLPPDGIDVATAMSEIVGLVDPWPAASPSSKSTKEAVDRLLFDIRGAMLRYGSAFKKGDEDGIRSTSTEACELLDRLAALASSSTKEDGGGGEQ